MALSADALTSLAALKSYLQISGDTHDALLESLIEAVSAQFNAYTGRRLTARDYSWREADPEYDSDNAVLDGTGLPELILPQYPVQSLAELALEGSPLELELVALDRSAGVASLKSGVFPRGKSNVGLVYQAGFATLPADLSQAALEQAAVRFQQSAAGHGRLGITARTLADGSLSYSGEALLPQVREVLDRYRNRIAL
jgi:uncharacterized phiE125 gp8 family phage protein